MSEGGEEWLREARVDLEALRPEARRPLLADQVVVAAREAAMKALKGYLAEQGEDAREVGDLDRLIALCGRHDPEFAQLSYGVEVLNLCAADDPSRPCSLPTDDDASEALEVAAGILRFVADRL